MAVPETIIMVTNYDKAEIVKRLKGCMGYLESRINSDNKNTNIRELFRVYKIITTAIDNIGEVEHLERTEYSPSPKL